MHQVKAWQAGRRSGFTLVEAVLVMAVGGLLVASAIAGVLSINQMNYHSAQRIAALGLCRERLELARSRAFSELNPTNYSETVQMTNLGGQRRVPLLAAVNTVVTAHTNPVVRRNVEVTATWTHGRKTFREAAAGIVYDLQP